MAMSTSQSKATDITGYSVIQPGPMPTTGLQLVIGVRHAPAMNDKAELLMATTVSDIQANA
jgi:hypothetical protein